MVSCSHLIFLDTKCLEPVYAVLSPVSKTAGDAAWHRRVGVLEERLVGDWVRFRERGHYGGEGDGDRLAAWQIRQGKAGVWVRGSGQVLIS